MEFVDHDGQRKVEFIQRADGGFSFEEFAFIVDEDVPGDQVYRYWSPVRGGTIPICETFEIALREARGRIPWLSKVLPDG